MPALKLSKSQKRSILLQSRGGRSTASIAEAFGITPQHTRRMIKDAHNAHYYAKCWYCGQEPLVEDIFCDEDCDAKWNAAQDRFLAGDKTALDSLHSESPESKALWDNMAAK